MLPGNFWEWPTNVWFMLRPTPQEGPECSLGLNLYQTVSLVFNSSKQQLSEIFFLVVWLDYWLEFFSDCLSWE